MHSFYKARNQKSLTPPPNEFMLLFKNYKGLEKLKIIFISNFSIGDGDGRVMEVSYYLIFHKRNSIGVVY